MLFYFIMEPGNVVEYIDRQKITCAVIMDIKKQKLRLLTENNREVKLSAGRLSHTCKMRLDLSNGRDTLVETLIKIADKRESLISHVDIEELWEVLNTEQEWIDLATMTEFCFPENPTDDHESAVVRAFFKNRTYFKFNFDRFFPNSQEKVEQIVTRNREAARKNKVIEEGSNWLRSVLNDTIPALPDSLSDSLSTGESEFVEILKSFYLFEKESRHYKLANEMLVNAGIDNPEKVFQLLVKLGIWNENENIELYKHEIPTAFSDKVTEHFNTLVNSLQVIPVEHERKDLTELSLITIDGQSTLDFDDAISIEEKSDHYRLGIHISDVGHFIKKGDILDLEARARGSSIYMPDEKIPMLPSIVAEDLCSLKAGELRPATSILVRLSPFFEILDYEIFPSLIKVQDQLTYYDVNMNMDNMGEILILHDIAKNFREKRLRDGAVQISLPEINIWINGNGEINVNKINRESPGRMLVAEIMILANWLMARFLAKHNMPAIFRSQPGPRERLYKKNEGSLFQNWMQRKLLSRFVLSHEPEHHSGLGLNAYVTSTSPIRKYFDLVTQRQIRSVFGLETPYTPEEIKDIIQTLETPINSVSRIQYTRNRYWLLKYLENKIGGKEEAIALSKRRNNYQILLKEYMIECNLPLSSGIELKPQDLLQVTIQHVNARKDVLSVYLG